MHILAEAQLDGRDLSTRFPGVMEHLSACASCSDDIVGIAAAAREFSEPVDGR